MIPLHVRCFTTRGLRRSEQLRWLLAALLLELVACQPEPKHDAALAPPTPSATEAPPTAALAPVRERPARASEVASTAHYSMSFSETKECVMEAPFRPIQGFIKLGVEVSIEAREALQVPANPFYATLIDAGNVVYESTLAGCQPALQARQLVKGQKAKGWITFDVPAQAKGLRLSYAPVLLGAGREELLFQLER